MKRDFTLSQYRALCEAILAKNWPILTFTQYLSASSAQCVILLRHDVDRWPNNALAMAKLEHDLGICSTYYFRATSHVFRPEIITAIASLGHEIGYHYETISTTKGNVEKARDLFASELSRLRAHADVKTACMHGSPLSAHDNRILWQHCTPRDFGLLAEVSMDLGTTPFLYFTDTGRSWNSRGTNLRDYCIGARSIDVSTTEELIDLLPSLNMPMVIQTHPERWNQPGHRFWLYWLIDHAALAAKFILRTFRKR